MAIARTPNLTAKDRSHFFATIYSLPVADLVRSPAVFREQLFAAFVNDLAWLQHMPVRYDALAQMREWVFTQDAAMTAATDALMLAQWSRRTADVPTHVEARRRYGMAMRMLRNDLSKHDRTKRETTLSAIDAVTACELDAKLQSAPDMWWQHSKGLLATLAAWDPSTVNFSSGPLRSLVFNAMFVAIPTNTRRRRRTSLARDEWTAALTSACRGRGWCLLHIVCQLPDLLEQADEAVKMDYAYAEISHILAKLNAVRARLKRWLHMWYAEQQEAQYRITDIIEHSCFLAHVGTRASAFPEAYSFSSNASAHGHLLYWFLCLSVLMETHRMMQREEVEDFVSIEDRQFIQREADETADAMCCSIPQTIMGLTPNFLRALSLAASWYRQRGDAQKLEYATAVIGEWERLRAEGPRSKQRLSSEIRVDDANAFLMRRLLFQIAVGPSQCVEQATPTLVE
jgi:hypothetical protein